MSVIPGRLSESLEAKERRRECSAEKVVILAANGQRSCVRN